MSLSVTRTLFSATGKLLRSSSRYGGAVAQGNSALYGGLRAQTPRNLTRSLWYMCRADESHAKANAFTHTCSCRCIHTPGKKTDPDLIVYEENNKQNFVPSKLLIFPCYIIPVKNSSMNINVNLPLYLIS